MTEHTYTNNTMEKRKSPKYSDLKVLENKLGDKIYKQLLLDGIDTPFWISDIAIGMHNLVEQEIAQAVAQAKQEVATKIITDLEIYKYQNVFTKYTEHFNKDIDNKITLLKAKYLPKEPVTQGDREK